MGRAFEVRKASMAKTGAAKAKLFSKFGKEIYISAKNGGADPEANLELKSLINKAKKLNVPGDVIKRNIDKAAGGSGESYDFHRYEGFGPGGSTLIVDCLTDNINRTVTDVRNCFTKTGGNLGVNGSVIHGFDHVSVVAVKDVTEDQLLEILLENDVDVDEVESEVDQVIVYGAASELFHIKQVIEEAIPNVEFTMEEQTMLAQNLIEITDEDTSLRFQKILDMLDDCDDVQQVYHNVKG